MSWSVRQFYAAYLGLNRFVLGISVFVSPVIVFGGKRIAEPTLLPPRAEPGVPPVLSPELGVVGAMPPLLKPVALPTVPGTGLAPVVGVVGRALGPALVEDGATPVGMFAGVVLIAGPPPPGVPEPPPVTTPEVVTEPVSAPVPPVSATPLGTTLTRGAFTPSRPLVIATTVPVLSGANPGVAP